MPDLLTISKDPNYVNANAATKQAIFEKWAPGDPNYAKANGPTQAAIRAKFGVGEAGPKDINQKVGEIVTSLGRGTASALDNTLGAVVPFAINQLAYAGSRAMGRSPQRASAIAQGASSVAEQPFGKAFGVTGTPEYQNEGSRQILDFVAKNVAKGAKWLSANTGLPETDIANMVGTLAAAAPEAAGALARPVARASAPMANALADRAVAGAQTARGAVQNAMAARAEGPALKGGGAMDTSAATRRQMTAEGLRRPLQLTKGQITRDPAQLRFENETRKSNADTAGRPLVERQTQQNEDILANFDAYLAATGAERAGEGQLRPVGQVVDKALVDYAKSKKTEIDKAYTAARESGEMAAPVPYKVLTDYIAQQTPTTRTKLAPIIQAVAEELKKNDPKGTGQIPINAIEDIRQMINKNTQAGTPNAVHARELKGLIDEATDGAGGDLYKSARQKRIQYAREFENVGAVDKLLRKKPGTTDRAVAMEDVFNHAVIDGSLDDTMAIGRTLKKAGETGQQAWRELQGQTVQHIRDQVTKSPAKDSAGNPFPSPAKFGAVVRELDSSGKLDYIFGKKGAQEIRDLNETVQTAYTAPPGTINYSSTAGIVVQALEKLERSVIGKIPGVGKVAAHVAEKTRAKELRNMVEDALYPNVGTPDATGIPPKIRPPKRRTNAMAPANSNANQNAMRK